MCQRGFLFVCHTKRTCLMKTWNVASRILQSTFLILLWCFCILYWTGKLQLQGKGNVLLLAQKCLLSCYTDESQSYVFAWHEAESKPILSSCMCLCWYIRHFCNDNLWGGFWEVVLKRCDIPLFNDEQHDTTWSWSITPFIELHQIVWKEKHKLTKHKPASINSFYSEALYLFWQYV